MKNKRAVILAGGKGTRLRPYTVVLPKPLMPIGEYPILEVIVRQLASAGFDRITIAVNHQAELIKAFFRDGRKWGIAIDYSMEDKPLNTMGPLTLIPDLPENFLVMNGDILTDIDFASFYDSHVASDAVFTISSHKRVQKIDYGVLDTNSDNKLIGFREKPKNEYQVSMGVYMLNSDALNDIPTGKPFGFDDLMHHFIKTDTMVNVVLFDGYWLDIGRPDDYAQAIEEFAEMKSKFIAD